MKYLSNKTKKYSLIVSALLLITGCATNPDKLKAPSSITCVYLNEPIATTGFYGMRNIEWTTRLERGPYWSEKVDDNGTFFRGPAGGVSITSPEYPSIPGQPAATDGGFYIPNDPKQPVVIYRYFTTSAVPIEVPADSLRCNNLKYLKDPVSNNVNIVSLTADSAINSSINTGSYSTPNAVGGVIGGLVVGSIINSEVGKIINGQPIQDLGFMEKLRELAASGETLKQVTMPSEL